MKVNVLTVDDVVISKFRWWSKWIDIAVFSYDYGGYLLQMKVSRNNSKRFKTTPFKSYGKLNHAKLHEAGNLTDMNSTESEADSTEYTA